MRYTIWKRFDFAASHVLAGLAEGHKCGRLHGHNYSVELELRSNDLDDAGFVVDYGELSVFRDWINANLDHRHLNDVLDFNPTAERVAAFLYRVARDEVSLPVCAVRVYETANTGAEYRPE